MITTLVATSQALQAPQAPPAAQEPEENQDLGGGPASQAHQGCRGPRGNEVCRERKVKGVLDLQDLEGCLAPQVHKENQGRVHQGPQVPEVLQVPLVVLETQVSEAPRVLLDTVTHPSVPASHTMDKAIQVPANKFSKSPVLLTV